MTTQSDDAVFDLEVKVMGLEDTIDDKWRETEKLREELSAAQRGLASLRLELEESRQANEDLKNHFEILLYEMREKIRAESKGRIEVLTSLLRDVEKCLGPIARTGRTSEGGEQRGNRSDVEDCYAKIRAALAKETGT